jgi:alkanesulfonate monooxygenase SsuD/methylene tetrahydromethanopterin reductase-like flavin-dependent oxidoreductase (luciferase family)
VTIAALAAMTTRLRFVTKIYVAAARPPVLVARAVATASVLSGNRVALGVGAGWMSEEFTIIGADFDTRGARLDEHIEVLRKLWQNRWVEHHRPHYDFPALRLNAVPDFPIPVYAGGEAKAAIRQAAALDGWLGAGYAPERLAELIARLSASRREAGTERSPGLRRDSQPAARADAEVDQDGTHPLRASDRTTQR